MYINGVNIKKHKRLIWNLLSRHSDNKLELLVRHMAGETTTSERRAIVEEVQRIAKPCTRRMDFASYFDDLCDDFTYEGITHNIDPVSKEVFENALKKTSGSFNIAIYEEVTQSAKSRYLEMLEEQEKNAQIIPATALSLVRSESSTDQSQNIKTGFFPFDPAGYSDKGLNNQTNNVEVIRLTEQEIVFLTSSQELLNCNEPYLYIWEIDRSYDIGDKIIIKCIQKDTVIQPDDSIEITVSISPDVSKVEFLKLQKLIEFREQPEVTKNVTVQNLYKSIEQRIHEHFFVNKTECIPMILSSKNGIWRADSSYITEDNNSLWNTYVTNKDDHLFERILNQPSFQDALNESPDNTLFYVVSPILFEGNKEVICIPYEDIINDEAACGLFKIYHNTNRVKLLRFQTSASKAKNYNYSPSILQNMVGGNLAMVNAKPNKKVQEITRNSELIMMVHDETNILESLGFNDVIAQANEPKYQKSKLIKKYILPHVEGEKTLFSAYENAREIRTEDRFAYKTEVSFKTEKDSESVNAETVNISSKGLCLKVANTDNLCLQQEILITFDSLNKRLKEKIVEQPYKIINIKDNSAHLMAAGTLKNNLARKLMTKLIYTNLDKLKPTGIKDKVYGLSRAMRSIYTQNHIDIPFFLSREKRQNFIETVLVNKLTKISNLNDQQDIMNLLSSPSFLSFTNKLFTEIDEVNHTSEGYLILLPKIKLKSGNEKLYWVKDLSEILENENGIEFISKIKKADNPSILKIKLRKPGESNNKYYSDEIAYLGRLNEQMKNSLDAYMEDMIAVGEVSDISDLIFKRIEVLSEKEKEKEAA